MAKMLLEMGQSHLFAHWAEPGVDVEEKKGFFEQVPVFFIANVLAFWIQWRFLFLFLPFQSG